MSKPNIDLQTPQGQSKEEINYRHHESCKTCAYFNGRIYCSKVRGHISPDAVCDLWNMREEPMGMTGKEIIEREYKKVQGGA